MDLEDDFRCSCSLGFEGKFCEVIIFIILFFLSKNFQFQRSTSMIVRASLAREQSPTATISSQTTNVSVRQGWKGNPVSSILTSVHWGLVNMEDVRMVSENIPVTATQDIREKTAPR